eukprot:Gregarina_sp_Poly_1__5214@NODE_2764_length_1747_cov_82_053571_g1743_i0_p1_GENE_NODE_2764_length_1747_cov_82_053571_g1743_i0NODE_2764_length_1747_cov_82_053571_g1743_i0_p1_ORF_typecomplete_len425_score55_88PHTB1_C/PF14728_6/0_22_NODE_2764_length_1747_cov_82_053571_g1743_i04591733
MALGCARSVVCGPQKRCSCWLLLTPLISTATSDSPTVAAEPAAEGETPLSRHARQRLEAALAEQRERERLEEEKEERLKEFRALQSLMFARAYKRVLNEGAGEELEDPKAMLAQPLESFKQVNTAHRLGLLPAYDLPTIKHILIERTDSKSTEMRMLEYRRQVAAMLKKDETLVTNWELNLIAQWYLAVDDYIASSARKDDKYHDAIDKWLSFKDYLLRTRDENSPLYTPEGRVDRRWLRPGWAVLHLKSVGEVVVPERFLAQAKEIQDAWVSHKFSLMSPMEKRGGGFEFQSNERAMSALNRFMGLIQAIMKRAIEARRPSDDDFDYGFPTEAEKPFPGCRLITNFKTPRWDIDFTTACILNDVYPKYRLRPVCSRTEALIWLQNYGKSRGLSSFNPNDALQLLDQTPVDIAPQNANKLLSKV